MIKGKHLICWWDFRTTKRASSHGPLTRYVKMQVAHAPDMPGTFPPPPRVSDPDMHHGTCVTHVPWCMPGSLTSGFLGSRWRGKRSRHSQRMRNPQFYVSGKRPIEATPVMTNHQQKDLDMYAKLELNAMLYKHLPSFENYDQTIIKNRSESSAWLLVYQLLPPFCNKTGSRIITKDKTLRLIYTYIIRIVQFIILC